MLIQEHDKESGIENCSFCSEADPSAMWMGSKPIFVCRKCATHHLPQLIADAIVGGTSDYHFKNKETTPSEIMQEKEILKRFYSAFSGALIRKNRI